MKELDVVKLLQDYENVSKDTIDTIVGAYDGKAFDVEFFDKNHDTIEVIPTPCELLELVIDFNY